MADTRLDGLVARVEATLKLHVPGEGAEGCHALAQGIVADLFGEGFQLGPSYYLLQLPVPDSPNWWRSTPLATDDTSEEQVMELTRALRGKLQRRRTFLTGFEEVDLDG